MHEKRMFITYCLYLFINRMNKYKLGLLKVINLFRVANKRWVTKAELIQQADRGIKVPNRN
jgi:hypothetical protein